MKDAINPMAPITTHAPAIKWIIPALPDPQKSNRGTSIPPQSERDRNPGSAHIFTFSPSSTKRRWRPQF
jgi:hypothetical protein